MLSTLMSLKLAAKMLSSSAMGWKKDSKSAAWPGPGEIPMISCGTSFTRMLGSTPSNVATIGQPSKPRCFHAEKPSVEARV